MTARKALLEDLLTSLVREWGYADVSTILTKVQSKDAIGERASAKKKGRPTAIEQIEAAKLPVAKEAILRDIALQFDMKIFLPNVADIREFVMMLGKQPKFINDRSAAFREVIYALEQLSMKHLEQIAERARYGGPSRLAPLSDAISKSSRSRIIDDGEGFVSKSK